MSDHLLTAAMIVRNEEAYLPACLESIQDVVDEIVIVDTGSTDKTVEIARSFGAQLHFHEWRGDFAAPRNVGLELAKGQWILYIDADERLRPISREAVRRRLREAPEIALRVQLRLSADLTPAWEYRLWRSDPRIRFEGTMHEKVSYAIARVAEQDHAEIGESELFLEHAGYEGDQLHKHRRNLPLLRAELAERPDDPYMWHHLATVLDALGDRDEAALALDRGIEAARASVGAAGYMPYLKLIADRVERREDATELLDEALARYPHNLGLVWLKLTAEIREGQYERALRRLERFDVDVEVPVEDVVAYPIELLGPRAAEARAFCLFKLGRHEEAATAYAEVERLEPDAPAHRVKRLLAEHRARAVRQISTVHTAGSNRFLWSASDPISGLTVDLGGVAVGLSAVDAVRGGAMRSLLGRVPPTDEHPAVRLRFGTHPTPLPARSPDGAADLLELWHDDQTVDVAFGSTIRGHAEGDRATLGGYADDFENVFRRTAPFLLASLFARRGRFLLHAAALTREARTVLVLGPSGSGKSTLVFGAWEDGWVVLSDDLVLIRPAPEGPEVRGFPKPVVVPSDIVGDQTPRRDSIEDHRGRTELLIEADSSWHAITDVALVGHGGSAGTEVEEVERQELLRVLMTAMVAPQRPAVRRYVALAIALCQRPAYRVLHSRAVKTRAQQAAAALAAQRRLSGGC